jgi:hypothetical protein
MAAADSDSFEALQREFGVDAAGVRAALELARGSGARLAALAAWEAAGGAEATARAEAAAAEAAADAALAAAERDAQAAAAAEARRERDALLAAKLAGGSPRGRGAVDVYAEAGPARADDDSDSSISLLSCSSGPARRPGGGSTPSSARGAPPPGAFSARGAGAAALASLAAELDKKGALFDDDASFLAEVHFGAAAADASLDVAREAARLAGRYKGWSRDFQRRLRATQQALRKVPPSPRLGGAPAAAGKGAAAVMPLGGVLPSPRASEGGGGLTSRLVGALTSRSRSTTPRG